MIHSTTHNHENHDDNHGFKNTEKGQLPLRLYQPFPNERDEKGKYSLVLGWVMGLWSKYLCKKNKIQILKEQGLGDVPNGMISIKCKEKAKPDHM